MNFSLNSLKSCSLFCSAWAAITKYHGRTPFAHRCFLSQFWKLTSPRSDFWQVWFFGEGFYSGLQIAGFFLYSHMVERKNSNLFLFLQGHQFHHGGSSLVASFKPTYLTKGPPPHAITLGVSTSTYEQSVHNTHTHINAGSKIVLPMSHA